MKSKHTFCLIKFVDDGITMSGAIDPDSASKIVDLVLEADVDRSDKRNMSSLYESAPDLLEALIEVEQMIHAGELNEGTMEIVRAAIEKAEGK